MICLTKADRPWSAGSGMLSHFLILFFFITYPCFGIVQTHSHAYEVEINADWQLSHPQCTVAIYPSAEGIRYRAELSGTNCITASEDSEIGLIHDETASYRIRSRDGIVEIILLEEF